jgi:hypothetical protein
MVAGPVYGLSSGGLLSRIRTAYLASEQLSAPELAYFGPKGEASLGDPRLLSKTDPGICS